MGWCWPLRDGPAAALFQSDQLLLGPGGDLWRPASTYSRDYQGLHAGGHDYVSQLAVRISATF